MALVFQKPKDDEENQGGSQPVTNNTGVIAPTAPAPVAAPTANKATSSGRFSNIKSYLDANKNFNAQGGGLAGKIASNLESSGQQVGQQVGQAVSNFGSAVQGQVTDASKGLQQTQEALKNPVSASEDQIKQVNAAQNAAYSGPKSLQDLEGKENQASLTAQVKNYTDLVNQGQSETGRFNLLKNMFNKPSYTRGQQGLDNLLIQGNKEQLNKIQNTRALANTANQTLNTGIQNAQNVASKAQTDVSGYAQQARQALNDRIVQENKAVQDNLNLLKEQGKNANIGYENALREGLLTQQQAASLGLGANDAISNLDLTKYLTKQGDPTLQQAGIKNFDTIQALKKLAGSNVTDYANSADAQKLFGDFATKAEQEYNPQGIAFDKASYSRDLANNKTEYQKLINSNAAIGNEAQNSLNNIQKNINYYQSQLDEANKHPNSQYYQEEARKAQRNIDAEKGKMGPDQQKLAAANKAIQDVENKYKMKKLIKLISGANSENAVANPIAAVDAGSGGDVPRGKPTGPVYVSGPVKK